MKNLYKTLFTAIAISLINISFFNAMAQKTVSFPIVDTGQETCYDSTAAIDPPAAGELFYGQDAQYNGYQPQYTDNGDGTITDEVTGLMWTKSYDMDGDGDIDYEDKMSYEEAMSAAETFSLAGYTDWRVPTIKEVYSLIMFYGIDPSGFEGSTEDLVPFINTDYFDFAYGDEASGERIIDAQIVSSNIYVGLTMMGDETMFGVNFADGRIKGYGTGPMPGQSEPKQFYVMFVRGNSEYGINDFVDNQDGTITDNATGLMWSQNDDGQGMTWPEALEYAENATLAGHSDWRLPNVKELQSIVDYSRAPSVTNSPALDSVFQCSSITNEIGETDYPFFWSNTTHANWTEGSSGSFASYVAFGEASGFMEEPPGSGNYIFMDVHGAGAQRSDPKTGNPDDYPYGNGPQGDVIRIYNFVRLVRDTDVSGVGTTEQPSSTISLYPSPAKTYVNISLNNTSNQIEVIKVFDLYGKLILNKTFVNEPDIILHIEDYPDGVYMIMATAGDSRFSGKFIKTR